ncbi:MAG: hypothetical protein WC986_13550 [Elusimicrobiota bacterium]|jgi:hypothetical protein
MSDDDRLGDALRELIIWGPFAVYRHGAPGYWSYRVTIEVPHSASEVVGIGSSLRIAAERCVRNVKRRKA